MRLLRVAFRIPALVVWTLLAHSIIKSSRLLRSSKPRLQLAIRNRTFCCWARLFARIAGMRIRVEGEPPKGAFLLVSNHVSYMDIVLLATAVEASFVAKSELRSWPVMGGVFAAADTIFIDRDRRRDVLRVMERISHDLDRQLGVVIFPEGTSSKGDEILPFKPPLLDFAARSHQPVHVATLGYTTPNGDGPASERVCWWGDTPFSPHVLELLKLPYFDARLIFAETPVQDSNRKALARRLHEATKRSFTPML